MKCPNIVPSVKVGCGAGHDSRIRTAEACSGQAGVVKHSGKVSVDHGQ